jgi:hypothetical protein
MKKSTQIVMSTASVAAALQVISGMAAQNKTLEVHATDSFKTEAATAASSAQAQTMIRSATPAIANSIKIDQHLMSEKYAVMDGEAAQKAKVLLERIGYRDGEHRDIAAAWDQDSTYDTGGLACYSNCHSACHGSRGWR